MSSPDMPSRIGRYRIVARRGQGVMGMVFLAVDSALDRKVALKSLSVRAGDGPTVAEAAERLRREAQAEARLSHPHVVQVFDFGLDDGGRPYIVMAYIDGPDLAAHLSALGRVPPVTWTCRLVGQLLSALEHAHRRGVVHRDIKPSNLMMLSPDDLVVTDFGISKLVGAGTLTAQDVVVGTPAFMAPEVLCGSESADHRVDVYAAGVVLYLLLCGRLPFSGPSVQHFAYQAVHVDATPPSRIVGPSLSPRFDAIVARAMAKRPEDRYASATAFCEELRSASVGLVGAVGKPRPAQWKRLGRAAVAASMSALTMAMSAADRTERPLAQTASAPVPAMAPVPAKPPESIGSNDRPATRPGLVHPALFDGVWRGQAACRHFASGRPAESSAIVGVISGSAVQLRLLGSHVDADRLVEGALVDRAVIVGAQAPTSAAGQYLRVDGNIDEHANPMQLTAHLQWSRQVAGGLALVIETCELYAARDR